MIEPVENEIGSLELITPLCACCKNAITGMKSLKKDCKIFGDSPMDIKCGEVYKCTHFILDKNIHYEDIKDKIEL